MEIIEYTKKYQEYKQELDTELRKTTEGFVKIGYLLKVAKDTDVLKESGYANVYEFAQAEYNIDKSQVSRFMNINDRFSENGYSPMLKEQFQGFGHAKLTIMLQLPDEINEELSPEYTKSEIQAIREEYDEEQKISDLEVLMEGEDQKLKDMESNLYKVLYQLGKEDPELYVNIYDAVYDSMAAVMDTMAPDGVKTYLTRIMGTGKMMLTIKGLDKPLTLTNIRTGEKEEYSWEDMRAILAYLTYGQSGPEETWSHVYGEEFPKKPQIAPVQPVELKKETPKKQSKVQKAKKPEPKKEEPKEESEPEEQIPGQDNILNHPEYLPESLEMQNEEPENVTESSEIVSELPTDVSKMAESVKKTECEEVSENANMAAVVEASEEADMAAGVDLDVEWKELWQVSSEKAHNLERFFNVLNDQATLVDNKIPKEKMEERYNDAVAVAAAIERMLNGKKYTTQ